MLDEIMEREALPWSGTTLYVVVGLFETHLDRTRSTWAYAEEQQSQRDIKQDTALLIERITCASRTTYLLCTALRSGNSLVPKTANANARHLVLRYEVTLTLFR